MDEILFKLFPVFPEWFSDKLLSFSSKYARVDEIRMRRNSYVSLTIGKNNVISDIFCSDKLISEILFSLCEGSLYSHSDTISQGYITYADIFRVGICGRAVPDKSDIAAVSDIYSLNIRIPHFIYGNCDGIISYLKSRKFLASILFFSPPGGGKTTFLRDIAYTLASNPCNLRVALIDSRNELYDGEKMQKTMIDLFASYPKHTGISIALRTLSPQYIVCDEIGSRDDLEALIDAQKCGVPIIASSHAENIDQLLSRPMFTEMKNADIFDAYASIKREKDNRFSIVLTEG